MAPAASRGFLHFIGIGGEGMTALAEILLERGSPISGSDVHENANTRRLAQSGARVAIGHDPRNLDGVTTVVYNTAIRSDNSELVAARQRGLRVLHRSELLGSLLEGAEGIAVAGTHGKSTTTSMLGLILQRAGLDPTIAAGAEVPNLGAHGHSGAGRHVVFEACESDGSFLQYAGCSEIITSIEPDHLDQHGSFAALCDRFGQFVSIADPEGFIVYCAETQVVRDIVNGAPARLISYGLGRPADYFANDIRASGYSVSYDLIARGSRRERIELHVPGQHNVLNSVAAVAAAEALGVAPDTMAEALAGFVGVRRRFERIYEDHGVVIVDDYAHHPTEVQATLRAAREGFDRRIICVFQPHLFSRTKFLMDQFGEAFSDADEVILTSIYGAREEPMEGVDGRQLQEAVAANEPGKPVRFFERNSEIITHLAEHVAPGDMILTLGAGNVREVAVGVAERISGQYQAS